MAMVFLGKDFTVGLRYRTAPWSAACCPHSESGQFAGFNFERKQTTKLLCEVNTALQRFVTSTMGAFIWLLAGQRGWFAVDLTATLPAKIAVLFLGGWNQPKTTTRLAQNR